MSRPLDVIIFGATGDTGSAACRLLYHHSSKYHIQKWAPAARNLTKLQRQVLQPILSASPSGGAQWNTPIQADSNDLPSLINMCRQTKVVVACAGPYSKYGEKVIAACIISGTHYVDVTGEVDWVNAMKKRYNNEAQSKGVSIVSFCGYDSIPMDMSAWLIANTFKERKDSAVLIETFATSATKGGGGVPTGTINTVLTMVNQIRYKFSFGLLGTAPPVHEKVNQISNQLQVGGIPLLTKRVQKAVKRDAIVNNKRFVSNLPQSKVWSTPHFMASINVPIVHATAEAEGFVDFEYHERALDGGRKAWEKAPTGTLNGYIIPTVSTLFTYLLAAPFVMTPFFESLVWWYVKNTNNEGKDIQDELGQNMVQKLMNSGQTTGYVGVKGYGLSKNGKKIETNFTCDYDAGIGFTMLSALSIAGTLVNKKVEEGKNGFQTPVSAIGGTQLRNALNDAGVCITVDVVEDDMKSKM